MSGSNYRRRLRRPSDDRIDPSTPNDRISVQKFLHGSVVAAFHAFFGALIDM
jgi:hypothetical protein